MPVLYFLIIVGVILLWALSAFLFKTIGKGANKIIDDVRDIITEEDKGDTKNE